MYIYINIYIWYHHKYTYTYTKTKKREIPKSTRINNIKNKQITNYISLTAETDNLPSSHFPAAVDMILINDMMILILVLLLKPH